jgi:hypothetical protein
VLRNNSETGRKDVLQGLWCLRENPPVPQGTAERYFQPSLTGLDFARIPYPALRAGLLSDVPSGLNPWTGGFSRRLVSPT